METITSSTMSACMQDYWYIWTFTSTGIACITAIDTVIAYFFLKKFFKTDQILPKTKAFIPNKPGPAWKSSSDSNSNTFSQIPRERSTVDQHGSVNSTTKLVDKKDKNKSEDNHRATSSVKVTVASN